MVDTGLQVLLEHRLIHHLLGYWADSRRQRDIALWASGPRKGIFTFVHPSIRPALYGSLPESRRRVLHRRIARVLEDRMERAGPRLRPLVASHYLAAWRWDEAFKHLFSAVDDSVRLGCFSTARCYLQEGLKALEEAEDRLPPGDALRRRLLDTLREIPSTSP